MEQPTRAERHALKPPGLTNREWSAYCKELGWSVRAGRQVRRRERKLLARAHASSAAAPAPKDLVAAEPCQRPPMSRPRLSPRKTKIRIEVEVSDGCGSEQRLSRICKALAGVGEALEQSEGEGDLLEEGEVLDEGEALEEGELPPETSSPWPEAGDEGQEDEALGCSDNPAENSPDHSPVEARRVLLPLTAKARPPVPSTKRPSSPPARPSKGEGLCAPQPGPTRAGHFWTWVEGSPRRPPTEAQRPRPTKVPRLQCA